MSVCVWWADRSRSANFLHQFIKTAGTFLSNQVEPSQHHNSINKHLTHIFTPEAVAAEHSCEGFQIQMLVDAASFTFIGQMVKKVKEKKSFWEYQLTLNNDNSEWGLI